PLRKPSVARRVPSLTRDPMGVDVRRLLRLLRSSAMRSSIIQTAHVSRLRAAASEPVRLAFALAVLVACALPARAQVTEYYHLDGLGSVRAVTNQSGQVIERHDYLPFGEECTVGVCAGNPQVGAGQAKKCTGKERDTETSLDYFGARYLASTLGRFTTVDPAYTW